MYIQSVAGERLQLSDWDVVERLYLSAVGVEIWHWENDSDSQGWITDAEAARLSDRTHALENALMHMPACSPQAFARKVLIALDEDRELDATWAAILVKEAREMVG